MNTTTVSVQQPNLDSQNVKRVFDRLFSGYTGSLGVRFWDGHVISLGRDSPVATVVIHAAGLLRHLAWHPDLLRLAEAYFYGEIDVEGDLYALLTQKTHLQSLTLSVRDRLSMLAAVTFRSNGASVAKDGIKSMRSSSPMRARLSGGHSKALNRHAIAFHYDVSNEFYRLWLDDEMVYSCAYFINPSETLEQAQRNKLDHICRKLRLKTGERLLDIGCGWGALICWAAKNYGVEAHGITLSKAQFEYAQTKIYDLRLEKQVTVELRDYRDLPAHALYDKVSSVGMFEHVGLKNLPVYFRAVDRVLKPGGLFLNHGITDNETETGKRKTVGTEFIQRYVFPDGELDCVSNVQREMELNGFEISDVEALRPHYAMTLRHWVRRLEARRAEALSHVSEARYRVWRLYMAGCAVQFENGAIGVYQILASKRGGGLPALPLTRADIYQSQHLAPIESQIR